MNCQKEHTALIWTVVRSHNCGLTMKDIIPNWICRTLCWRVTGQSTKFLINPFQHHSPCFSSASSLSRCVLEGPAKTLRLSRRLGRTVSSSHTGSAGHGRRGARASLLRLLPGPAGLPHHGHKITSSTSVLTERKGFFFSLTGSTFKKRVSSVTAYSLSAAFLITSFLKLLLKGNL